ncbi:MAG TPA: magnesium/cobalt transporter CorA [Actinomycetota bacterium]|nr:magnesium/cobalt transporter CorA [Actinomycetota bacterium]
MLTVRLYQAGRVDERRMPPERVGELLEEPDTIVWLDLVDPTRREIETIQQQFDLHELTVEDVQHKGQRPKFELYPNYYFVVLYGIAIDGDDLRTHEVHAFVAPRFLATIRYGPALPLEPMLERCRQHAGLAKEGAGFLLYALLDYVVDDYFTVAERIEDRGEAIEDAVFEDVPGHEVQQELFTLRKQLVTFRRLVAPMREVVNAVSDDTKLVTEQLRFYYRDVTDHVLRVLDYVDNMRELLTTAQEVRIAQVGNRLNTVMKKVTSWAAILLVPTLIAGIYGMNFRYMPELDWRFGYPFSLGLMALAGFVLYRLFRRQDWL